MPGVKFPAPEPIQEDAPERIWNAARAHLLRWRTAHPVTEPAPPAPLTPDRAIRQTTLKAIALLIGVAATVLTPLVRLSSSNPLEVW